MSLRPALVRARFVFAVATWSAAALGVSCGSRTGLFGPEVDLPDDAGAVATLEGAVPCVPGRFAFDLALTQLMLVIDRSGSMAFSLDGRPAPQIPEEEKRWRVLQRALETTLGSFDQQIAMGAKFFPEVVGPNDTSVARACRTETGVGIAPARGNAGRITSVFDTSEPRGGTPTAEAVRIAAQFLSQSRSVARTIVLATDGAPNCNEDLDSRTCVCTAQSTPANPNPCATAVRDVSHSCLDDGRAIETIRRIAEEQAIPFYVIGIGGTERPEFLRVLDDMAVAGGRPRPTLPRHYNVQSATELTDALTTIRDSVAKCTFLTPSAPTDPDRITVEIGGTVIQRDPTKVNGWDWVDRAFGWLALFGEACERVQEAPPSASTISGIVSCEE